MRRCTDRFRMSAKLSAVQRLNIRRNGCWQNSLFAIGFAHSASFFFRELGPGLGHFDQQGFVGLIGGLAGQAETFGRAPLVILDSGHGTLRLRANASAITLFRPALKNMRATMPPAVRDRHERVIALIGLENADRFAPTQLASQVKNGIGSRLPVLGAPVTALCPGRRKRPARP
jgi:hypothetical protein